MALEAEILENNYGLPADFARSFIQFTKGDIESAIRVIESSEKDMVVLKMKFISSKKMINGALMLFYNFQTGMPEYAFAVVTGDQNLSRIRIENPWRDVEAELQRHLSGADSDPEFASKIEARVLYSDNLSYLSSFFLDKTTVDLTNIKRFILNEISKVLMDTGIILKLVSEEIDVFRFRSFLTGIKHGLKVAVKNRTDFITLLNLRIEPLLAPLGGTDIEKVRLGDDILVRIADAREIVPFALSFVDPARIVENNYYGKMVMKSSSPGSDNTMVIVEFGPGIYGKFIIGGKIRLQIREQQGGQPAPAQKEPSGNRPAADQPDPQKPAYRDILSRVPRLDEIPKPDPERGERSSAPESGGEFRRKSPSTGIKNINAYVFIWLSIAALTVILLVLLMVFG